MGRSIKSIIKEENKDSFDEMEFYEEGSDITIMDYVRYRNLKEITITFLTEPRNLVERLMIPQTIYLVSGYESSCDYFIDSCIDDRLISRFYLGVESGTKRLVILNFFGSIIKKKFEKLSCYHEQAIATSVPLENGTTYSKKLSQVKHKIIIQR